MTRDQFPQTGRDTPYPPDDPDTERPDGPIPVPEGPDRPPPPDPPPPPVSDQTGQPEQGSTDPFLTIDGIDGEATDTAHGGTSTALGAGRATGENSITDIDGVVTMNGRTARAADDQDGPGRDTAEEGAIADAPTGGLAGDFGSGSAGQAHQQKEEDEDTGGVTGLEFGAGAEPDGIERETVAAPDDTGDAEPEHAVAEVTDAEPEHASTATSDAFTHAISENVAAEPDAAEEEHSPSAFDMDG
ncbi:hypothetical protein H0B56_05685 [Haloechinothrix sp. YIM 98757]|uniref:Uncharacterized protein n=1 Tax=Haloechinothrix aidingensis TaxID=2752311 RepID=A0A838A770_9PSEU|nr:hypothetical protein [Haloechinothrix aidingensis]MBA0125028.1 hypothetical protein [Haloechinothrix aidingensis]